jgi:hypothetical protein
MMRRAAILSLVALGLSSIVCAQEGHVPKGIPHLDHVFIIMMENHGYSQIVNNPNALFLNKYAKEVNSATNYFAVAHPSLTNYLEVVGGSNFGVLNDNSPDWHNKMCKPNIFGGGTTGFDVGTTPPVCPISGTGTDAATPVFDNSNETVPPAITSVTEIDGKMSIPANPNTVGKTIADQLAEHGMSWKSYQESLPPTGADMVNTADGFFSNLSDLSAALPGEGQTQSNLVSLYAVKHNPFVYFQSVQEGWNEDSNLKNTVGFEGSSGLFADLSSGHVPNFAFIAPNQCNDQHGRGNGGPACEYDPNDDGTQNGLNPGLIYRGDVTVQLLVSAIHHSPAWREGRSAIIVLWDENDYSAAPYPNKVLLTVDTNYGSHGVQSNQFYTHFSLLKSIEAAFNLPCLNHACDANETVMSDLFGGQGHDHDEW